MALRVAIIMDELASVDIQADSTFELAVEGQRRGHELYYGNAKDVFLWRGEVRAKLSPLKVQRKHGAGTVVKDFTLVPLQGFDVVLMRQDPPFNMNYLTVAYLLGAIHPKTLVVNNPDQVRNLPEKLFITKFQQFTPPTVITRDMDVIDKFRRLEGEVVIKPLYGNSGNGIFRLLKQDSNAKALIEMLIEQNNGEPLVVQKYLPNVMRGDKRVFLVDGKVLSAINRVPPKGEFRANLHVGGFAKKTSLSKKEMAICSVLAKEMEQRDIIFAGLDLIDGMVTEINVTSPTGLQEARRFYGISIARHIWNAIERRRG